MNVSVRVRGLAAVVCLLTWVSGVLGQVGLASQSRVVQVFGPQGTFTQTAPTFGIWNQFVGFGAPQTNSCDVQSNVSESTIRFSGNSIVWEQGNPTSSSPVVVNVNVAFNLFAQASFALSVSDQVGLFASASFTLTGPSGVVASGRTLNITSGTLLPGAYTLTYNFTHNFTGFASAGRFGFTMDFTGFQPGPRAVTYQGRVDNAGSPASGPHDVAFVLYTEPTGGQPLVFGQEQLNVPVTGGVFTTSFDFGLTPWETVENRWLEVAVRPSGSGQPYEVLSPRQRVAVAPRALFAEKAGSATSALTANSATTAGTADLALGLDSLSRATIRGEPGASGASPGLLFASPADNPIARGFVGMANDNNVGFFGYAGGGWSLTMRTDTGRVGIGTFDPGARLEVAGEVRATGFQYPTMQTRSMMIGYTQFRCQGAASPAINNINFGAAGPDGTATPLIATVSVPEGSVLLDLTVYFRDQENVANLRLSAFIYNMDVPNLSNLFPQIDLAAAQGSPVNQIVSISGGTPTTSNTQVVIQLVPVNGLWNAANTLTVQGVRLRYSVSGPR